MKNFRQRIKNIKFVVKDEMDTPPHLTFDFDDAKNLYEWVEYNAKNRTLVIASYDKSVYFECFGVGTYSVKIDDEEVVSGELTSKHGYSPYKAHIPNAYDKKVVLEITSSYPLAVKNVALYSADFESLEDIQPFSEKVRYNLRELAPDFYALDSKSIYFEGDESN